MMDGVMISKIRGMEDAVLGVLCHKVPALCYSVSKAEAAIVASNPGITAEAAAAIVDTMVSQNPQRVGAPVWVMDRPGVVASVDALLQASDEGKF